MPAWRMAGIAACWLSLLGRVKTILAAIAAATGSATTSARRQVNLRLGVVSAAAIRRTRSRSSDGAVMRVPRSSAARSRCDMKSLLERPVEARRAVGGRDAQDIGGGDRIELQHDPERDDLAFPGGEDCERGLEVVRQAFGELLLEALRPRSELLAARAPALGAEVVESDGARNLAEPGSRGAAALSSDTRLTGSSISAQSTPASR